MDQQQKAILFIASRLLSYPEGTLLEGDLDEFVDMHIESEQVKADLKAVYAPLVRLPLLVRKELYVETFDLRSKTGLYLTAHELGDSPKRGAALLRLKNVLRRSGFDHIEGELADYLPLLFEYLAVSEKREEHERLIRRIAAVLKRVHSYIDEKSYAQLIQMLITYVFPTPTEEEMKRMAFEREEADLEDMPYPIMYQ